MKTEGTEARRGTTVAILAAILVASFALSIFFALHVPFNGNPDETDHRDYIRLIIQNHGLVKFTPAPFDTPSTDTSLRPFETHQPPLYYLLCIPVQLLSGGSSMFSLFAVRIVAALLQLLTILVVYRTLRDVFPKRDEIALGAAGFVAFLPTQAQLAGAISNDALTTLVCTVLFWKLSRLFRRDGKIRDSLMIGAVLGIGIWTKLSVLQLIPAIALAFAFSAWMGRRTWRQAVQGCLVALGVGLAIGAPWLIRNTMLYGDPLALRIYSQTGPNFTPSQIMNAPAFQWTFGDYARNVGIRSFVTFWYFLNPNLLPKHFTGNPIVLLTTLALALGALLGVYRAHKEGDGTPQERRFLGFCILAIVTLVPFFVRFVLTVFQAQGRYFLPILLPAAAITSAGWAWLLPAKRGQVGILVMNLVLLGLCVYEIASEGVY